VSLILKNLEITQDKMAEIMGMSKNGIRYTMNKSKNSDILVQVEMPRKENGLLRNKYGMAGEPVRKLV